MSVLRRGRPPAETRDGQYSQFTAPWTNGQTVPAPYQDPSGRMLDTVALRVSAVWACVRIIADSVAASPLDVYVRRGAQKTNVDTPPVLLYPQPGWSQYDWLFALTASLLLTGNAYVLKSGLDRLGYATQLPLLDPAQMRVRSDGDTVTYTYGDNPIPTDRLLHIRAFTLPGRPTGLSPLEQFAQTIGVGSQAERFGYRFFADGGIPSAILYSDEKLDKAQADGLRTSVVSAWRNRRGLAVLGSGLRYERVQVQPSDSQFLDTQRFSIEQICSIFGVRPAKIGHATTGSSVTYATLESAQLDFQTDTVRPWATRIETRLSDALPAGTFLKLNLDSLVRVDLLTRYKAHGMGLRDGWRSADEIRDLEDLAPIPDGTGDQFLWPIVAKPHSEPYVDPAPVPAPGGSK